MSQLTSEPPLVICIMGTRPEVVKLAPVVRAINSQGLLRQVVLNSGQHRELAADALASRGLVARVTLDTMAPGQALSTSFGKLVVAIGEQLRALRPAMVVVQGDTSTTLAGALAGFYERIPVAHVEAGLRTGDLENPFPEEANRRLVTTLSTLHFAPTQRAADSLFAEGVPSERVWVVGNTSIDEVLLISTGADRLQAARKQVLVTVHRRENHASISGIAAAIKELAMTHPEVDFVLPVHPNPAVKTVVIRELAGLPNVELKAPMDYEEFVRAMARSWIVISDSGGVQEEAPALGVPVVVMREATERPEVVEAGGAVLVGSDPARIVRTSSALIDDPEARAAMVLQASPYGNGDSGKQIAERLAVHLLGG